ncbi:hypothetical protein [Mycobacterium sp.]|uniref:hypothetical protein n=1 Tax=Mycobacterium sp. TaxID=1785 RepID=UPI003A86AC27
MNGKITKITKGKAYTEEITIEYEADGTSYDLEGNELDHKDINKRIDMLPKEIH